MLQTLIQAQTDNSRVSLVLASGVTTNQLSIINTNTLQVTVEGKDNQRVINLSDIDIIFVYKNTPTAATVESWAVNPSEPPADPVLGLAVTSTFNLQVVFDSDYTLECVVLGQADPTQSDLAFIANVIDNPNIIAVFINNNVSGYDYDVETVGSGTVGDLSSADIVAASTYYVRVDGDDANAGTADSPEGAFNSLAKALDTLRSARGNNQDVVVELGLNDNTTPYIIPATTDGFRDYNKVTLRSRDNDVANTYVDFAASTARFVNFNELQIQTLRVISGTVISIERTDRGDVRGCQFDTNLRVVSKENSTVFCLSNTFNGSYTFTGLLDVSDNSTLCFESNNTTPAAINGVFATVAKKSRCEVNKVITIPGKLTSVSEQSFARFEAGSTEGSASIIDLSSYLQIGTVIQPGT